MGVVELRGVDLIPLKPYVCEANVDITVGTSNEIQFDMHADRSRTIDNVMRIDRHSIRNSEF